MIKNSMLKKMFPKEGSSIPEVRFKDFKEKWSAQKLNEISTYHASTYTVGNALSNGKYKLYDANEVIGFVNENPQSTDYITIIKDGSGVGRVRLLPKNTTFIGTMGGIRANKSNINFLYYLLLNFNFHKHITGATIPHIYYSSYGNEELYVPCSKEQTLIGDFFRKIDTAIDLNKREYEKFKTLKKAFFDKMTSASSIHFEYNN
jgi:type I restriction enzyme S subunit